MTACLGRVKRKWSNYAKFCENGSSEKSWLVIVCEHDDEIMLKGVVLDTEVGFTFSTVCAAGPITPSKPIRRPFDPYPYRTTPAIPPFSFFDSR